jgi:glycosyltransferase involved in cell wall biosynthesis
MHKVSALIHTYNNEAIIARCLESVKWADEIVICDSFSSDKTVDICKTYTDKIYYYEHKNSADQKNWAIPKCSHEWILQIDTDEVVTPELSLEIQRIFLSDSLPEAAFMISTKNHIFGKWMRGANLYPDYRIRLFKKNLRYEKKWIHARLLIQGEPVGQLENHVLHYGFQDWKTIRWKFKRYRKLEYLRLKEEGTPVTLYKVLSYPCGMFIYLFFIKKGFMDGWRGLFWSLFVSLLKFFVYKDRLLKL